MKRKLTLFVAIIFGAQLTMAHVPTSTNIKNVMLPDKPEEIFLKHADACLERILEKAKALKMTGAAAIAFMPKSKPETWISKMKILENLATDKANFTAVAYSKLGEMAVTLEDSGEAARKQILGEYGFIGGVCYEVPGGYLLGAFSGGPGEDDLKAARAGLAWFKDQF